MDIPFLIILILYIILLVGIGVLALFNIWHMVRFGMFDFTGKLNTVVFVGFSIIILVLTVLLLINVNWFDTFAVGEILNFSFGGDNNTLDI